MRQGAATTRTRGGTDGPAPIPEPEPLSQLTADVSFTPQSAKLVREAAFDKEGGEGYLLTLTDAEGAEIRVALRADEGASPFGRYDFSRANDCVPGSNDGADAATGSWYYASQKAVAPIVGGVLDLSRVPGNKPSDTSYRVQVAFEDDHSPAFGITAVYSGAMTLEGVDATPDATTTYCYAGASGFYADDGYNSWGIDFDNADFTHLLSIFEFNVAPDATEQDGIPAGIYTITEDYAPNTVTWATYDEEMTYLSTGTVTVERDGEEYKVTVDAVDEYDAPFKADFAGQIYYENTSEQASISPREVYVVCYGEKDGLTNWYITLVDRGYLTTRDAVGNCYYGSILHFDLRSDAANDYADGVPEGTFAVRNGQSGVGIWGGDNAACTSFLAEYFSGSPAIGKLTEGNVTIARDGEWYEISFDGLTLAGSDQTSLTGSYEGRVQYIDARGKPFDTLWKNAFEPWFEGVFIRPAEGGGQPPIRCSTHCVSATKSATDNCSARCEKKGCSAPPKSPKAARSELRSILRR